MVKLAPRILLIVNTALFLVSCSIPPSYDRKNIEKVITNICSEEFNINVVAQASGDTIWIYAPFEKLIDEKGEWDKEASEDVRRIFLSLSRAFLNMEKPPDFFCFVASDVKDKGADLYVIGFIPDVIKFDMGFISLKEREQRLATIFSYNPRALGDKEGSHILKYPISINEFVLLLMRQNIIKEFTSEEMAENFKVNLLETDYNKGQIAITFDIAAEKNKKSLPTALEKIEETVEEILAIYSDFHSIKNVVLQDILNKRTRNIPLRTRNTKDAENGPEKDEMLLHKISKSNYYFNLGNESFVDKKYNQALNYYLKALSNDPQHIGSLLNAANIYIVSGLPEKALPLLEKAESIKPDYFPLQNLLGFAYNSLNQPERSIDYYKKAIENNPDNPDTYYNLGIAYHALEKYGAAIAAYEKTLGLNPDYIGAYINLGVVLAEEGNLDKARKNLQTARELFLSQGNEKAAEEIENYINKLSQEGISNPKEDSLSIDEPALER